MIKLNIDKNQFSPKFYPYLFDYSHRFEIYRGGAGSGKSHFIVQKLLIKALTSKRKICMCRRYGTTIQKSIWDLTMDILKQWRIYEYVQINKALRSITFQNGSQIYFVGLDDEYKLLSITGITDFFIEEVFEITEEMMDQIDLRLRSKAPNLQIYAAFNPISSYHWLYEFCEGSKRPKSFLYLESTFRDNPFLPKEYVESLESLYVRNPNKARIFCDNLWGVDVEGVVFKNAKYEEIDANALLKDRAIEVRIGSDSGVVDPSTIVVSLFDRRTQTIYVINEWYLRGATLDDHYNAIEKLGLLRNKIMVDSADTRLIKYLQSKRVNAVPVVKGKGSVEARIDYLLNCNIVIDPKKCPNTTMEFQNFSWIKDKQTSKYTEKTTHEWAHTVDALSYAYNDLYSGRASSFVKPRGL